MYYIVMPVKVLSLVKMHLLTTNVASCVTFPSKYEFGWLLPLPCLQSFYFDLNWEILLQDVCTILGFSSPKALEYARRCSDHHKS